jgi:ABC-type sugar transport system ATPase subunit
MNSPVLEMTNFSLSSQTLPTAAARCLLAPGAKLVLPQPGIYTLEGDNQAGKSTLLKVLMGALRTEGKGVPNLKIAGKSIMIRNIADAKKAGLGAVFQDDPLIPSLTVADQLVLVHAGNKLQVLTSLLKAEHNRTPSLTPHAVLNAAAKLLDSYGSNYASILTKYPGQLSGGALAVAKLIKAQLQSPLQVLFLDEPFSGVQRDVWPAIIDQLRIWSNENQVSILAVSHSDDEIARLMPVGRFIIRNNRIDTVAV